VRFRQRRGGGRGSESVALNGGSIVGTFNSGPTLVTMATAIATTTATATVAAVGFHFVFVFIFIFVFVFVLVFLFYLDSRLSSSCCVGLFSSLRERLLLLRLALFDQARYFLVPL
jgi:hypothetical protein